MSFLNILNKRKVPEELPNLVFNEVVKEVNSPVVPVEVKEEVKKTNEAAETIQAPKEINLPIDKDENGFFKEMVKNITEDSNNIEEVEGWYNSKFASQDVVHQMREYWEKQKPEILIKNASKQIRDQILEKTDKLHKLEKEWQNVYVQLITKEEEIRTEEKSLKKDISEFMNICKKHLPKEKKGKDSLNKTK